MSPIIEKVGNSSNGGIVVKKTTKFKLKNSEKEHGLPLKNKRLLSGKNQLSSTLLSAYETPYTKT